MKVFEITLGFIFVRDLIGPHKNCKGSKKSSL